MKNATDYTIQLPVYEGPLDLLLELIERAELDITKISLAKVTDQYLHYLKRLSRYELEDISSFIVIAARLLQIKSEALLPRPPEREAGEEDPGDALARQLVAYKKYKQIAVLLSEREEAGLRTFQRQAPAPMPDPRPDVTGLDVLDLKQALEQIALEEAPAQASLESVVKRPVVRVRDRIRHIIDSLRDLASVDFRTVVNDVGSRLEIVVSFLAVLELVKQGHVEVEQQHLFGDIEIRRGRKWDRAQSDEFELEFEE